MGEFRFKRFTVKNERSAMKVNTDGVLLGALMTLDRTDRNLLDVGTGTGTIALMAAQRLSDMPDAGTSFRIGAIDIDGPSAFEAAENFARSPWSSMLAADNLSLSAFSERMEVSCREMREKDGNAGDPAAFDLVFSNPPYFESELKSPDSRRREARHSESMSYRDILHFSARWLSPCGRCSMILPSETETDLCRYARMCGLFPFRIVRIRTVPAKPPRRAVVEFSRTRCGEIAEELVTIQEQGRYTERYTDLMSPFYLKV